MVKGLQDYEQDTWILSQEEIDAIVAVVLATRNILSNGSSYGSFALYGQANTDDTAERIVKFSLEDGRTSSDMWRGATVLNTNCSAENFVRYVLEQKIWRKEKCPSCLIRLNYGRTVMDSGLILPATHGRFLASCITPNGIIDLPVLYILAHFLPIICPKDRALEHSAHDIWIATENSSLRDYGEEALQFSQSETIPEIVAWRTWHESQPEPKLFFEK